MPSSRRALVVAALLALPASLSAQSIWTTPLAGRADIDLEWTHPHFEAPATTSTLSGVWIATGRYRVGKGGAVVVAIPRLVAEGSSSLGNPYLGYQASVENGRSVLNLGVRLPYASGGYAPEQDLALRTDFDRFEEMLPDILTIRAEAQGKVWQDSSGADVRARAGMSIFHPTGTGSTGDNTFLVDYGVRFGREFGKADLGVAMTGRYFMSGNGGGFNQRNATEADIELAWRGPVTPRASLRIPVTETLKSAYKTALTLGLEVPLP